MVDLGKDESVPESKTEKKAEKQVQSPVVEKDSDGEAQDSVVFVFEASASPSFGLRQSDGSIIMRPYTDHVLRLDSEDKEDAKVIDYIRRHAPELRAKEVPSVSAKAAAKMSLAERIDSLLALEKPMLIQMLENKAKRNSMGNATVGTLIVEILKLKK